jgi:hypothetical protein
MHTPGKCTHPATGEVRVTAGVVDGWGKAVATLKQEQALWLSGNAWSGNTQCPTLLVFRVSVHVCPA